MRYIEAAQRSPSLFQFAAAARKFADDRGSVLQVGAAGRSLVVATVAIVVSRSEQDRTLREALPQLEHEELNRAAHKVAVGLRIVVPGDAVEGVGKMVR